MAFIQLRINVDTTSWRLYNVALTPVQRHDVNATSQKRHVPAGLVLKTICREIMIMSIFLIEKKALSTDLDKYHPAGTQR